MYDGKKRRRRAESDDESEEYSSCDEQESKTFLQKVGSFIFFGCGGSNKK